MADPGPCEEISRKAISQELSEKELAKAGIWWGEQIRTEHTFFLAMLGMLMRRTLKT